MSEMVERVAEALFVKHYFPAPALWIGEIEQRKEFYRGLARAAIDTMRTPTLVMLHRANGHLSYDPPVSQAPSKRVITQAWHMMIDAALGEPSSAQTL